MNDDGELKGEKTVCKFCMSEVEPLQRVNNAREAVEVCPVCGFEFPLFTPLEIVPVAFLFEMQAS